MKFVAVPALLAAAAAVLVAAVPVHAEEAPSVRELTEQLKPAPRTRSLRNLAVEAAVPAQPPSVSLLIQFDFDSARVRPESEPVLHNLAEALRSPALAQSRFAVEGHTDAKGAAAYNQQLSQRRAEAVRDLLVRDGVDQARLVASGKGASEPADKSDPYAAANRRVRVVNLD